MDSRSFHVDLSGDGERLDLWLAHCCPDLSRSRIQQLIKEGAVQVQQRTGVKANRKMAVGEDVLLSIPAAQPVELVAEDIPLDILFEDESLVVVNKPPGLVVHPAPGHASGTLVNALMNHCHDLAGIGGEIRPGIVHRLDKDTSGVMVVAKSEKALQQLQAQFKARTTLKIYLALVRGIPRPPHARIETLIGRSGTDRKRMSTTPPSGGRPAVSEYWNEADFGDAARVRVQLFTGRTHQVRVHMAHIGCPLLGDRLYGRNNLALRGLTIPRQMLHAHVLEIAHPMNGAPLRFEAPLPGDFREWNQRLDSPPGKA